MSVPSLTYALVRAAPIIFPAHVTLQSITERNYAKMVGFLGGLGATVLLTTMGYTPSQSDQELCKTISLFGNSITIPAISFAMVFYTLMFLIGSDNSFVVSPMFIMMTVCVILLAFMELYCSKNPINMLLLLMSLVGLPIGIWFKNNTKETAQCDFNQKRFRCRSRTTS